MKRLYIFIMCMLIPVLSFADISNGSITGVVNATKLSEKYNGCAVYIWNGTSSSIQVNATVTKTKGWHDPTTYSYVKCVVNGNVNINTTGGNNTSATIPISNLTKDYNSICFKLEDANPSTGSYTYYVTNTIYIKKATTYTITWKNYDGSTLTTTQVAHGATPSYTGSTPTRPSTAQYTYTFKGWTPTIVAATGNATYTATYTQTLRKYTITVNTTNTTMGTVSGGGSYDYGANRQISANPAECYQFVRWSDSNTNNPRTVTVTGNATYTAIFEKVKYTIRTESDNISQGKTKVEK